MAMNPTPPDTFRIRVAFAALGLAALAAATDSILNFRGVYRWLIEWQLSRGEWYYAGSSAAFTYLSYLGLAAVLGGVGIRLGWLPAGRAAQVLKEWRPGLRRMTHWIRERRLRLALTGAAIALLGTGAGDILVGISAGNFQTVSVADVRKGTPISGRWVGLSDAQALIDRGVIFGQTSKDADFTQYTPVVASGATTPDDVAIFLKARRDSFPANAALPPMSGIVSYLPLSAFARREFEKNGITVAPQTWVIEWGAAPSDSILGGVISAAMGILLLAGTSFFWLRRPRGKASGNRAAA
jgi:hypothetical protein